jgi:hypothetical protein
MMGVIVMRVLGTPVCSGFSLNIPELPPGGMRSPNGSAAASA